MQHITEITKKCHKENDENNDYSENGRYNEDHSNDYSEKTSIGKTLDDCELFCIDDHNCDAFTWKSNKECWLRISVKNDTAQPRSISGQRYCGKKSMHKKLF